jgi:hypothetical protein
MFTTKPPCGIIWLDEKPLKEGCQMTRRMLAAVTAVAGLMLLALLGCGGGKGNPISQPPGGTIQPPSGQTGIVEGRLVTGSSTTGKSRQFAARFKARVHGLETENTFRLQIRTNGEFRIEGVPVGEQVISIEDEESQQGAVIVCFVRPGQVTNVGDVVPQPLGMIAGFVRTTDENGQLKPVPRARIIARPISDESDTVEELPARPFFTTITDKNGSYRLLVPEGTYLVEARHPDYEPASETVTVKVLEVTPLNFTLVPLPRETGTVYGTVMAQVDGNLIPVPGALVMLQPDRPIPLPEPIPEPIVLEKLTVGQLIRKQMNPTKQGFMPPVPPIYHRLFTFTKADGSFELTGVPAGSYTAIAFKLGYGRNEKQVEVKTGEKVRVDFVLQAQFGTITGQVTDATTGNPIKGALVVAVRKGDNWWIWSGWEQMPLSGSKKPDRPTWHRPNQGGQQGMPSQSPLISPLPPTEPPIRAGTKTDENGNYKLLLPPGDYFVAAVAEGYEWQAQEVEGLQAGKTVQVDFALQPTATIQ